MYKVLGGSSSGVACTGEGAGRSLHRRESEVGNLKSDAQRWRGGGVIRGASGDGLSSGREGVALSVCLQVTGEEGAESANRRSLRRVEEC